MAKYIRLERNVVTEIHNKLTENMVNEREVEWLTINDNIKVDIAYTHSNGVFSAPSVRVEEPSSVLPNEQE